MKSAVLFSAVLVSLCAAACGKTPTSSSEGAAAIVPSGIASVAPSAPSPAASASAAPPAAIPASPLVPRTTARCCRLDKREGIVGNEHAVHTCYAADTLLTKSDKRIFSSDDVVSDTTELFQHARSMGRSLRQERALAIVGEGPRSISITVDDRGDSGAGAAFRHSACKTLDPNTGKLLKVEDFFEKTAVDRVLAEAKDALAKQPGARRFRVVSTSFAITDDAKLVFCAPAEDAAGDDVRRDLAVTTTDADRRASK